VAHRQHGILHHEVHYLKEFLQFTELVCFLAVLVNIEPTFADTRKFFFNDLFKAANPALLPSVISQTGDLGALVLLELLNSHYFATSVSLEDPLFLDHGVAFIFDLHHCADDLVFDE
jgi:hypothetical protein